MISLRIFITYEKKVKSIFKLKIRSRNWEKAYNAILNLEHELKASHSPITAVSAMNYRKFSCLIRDKLSMQYRPT